MKSVWSVILLAVVSGLGVGAALGYLEGRLPPVPPAPAERPSDTSSAPQQSGPLAEIPETTFDFGRMERGSSMTHAFKIRNVGDEPLQLEVASTTCKCTVGDLSNNEVAPGEESDVLLDWVAKTPPGPFRHGASLSTNDPRHPRIELVVEGKVVESTTLQPAEMLFGTVQAGGSQEASCYLLSSLEEDVQILKHEIADPAFADQIDISISSVDPAEVKDSSVLSARKVTATYHAGTSQGPFLTWLTLETNLPKAERLSVPLSGNVVGDISVFGPGWIPTQNLLRLGNLESKQGKQARLNIAIRGEHARETALAVASIDPPELRATLGEPREMNEKLVHIPLLVEVPPGTRAMVRMSKDAEDEHPTHGDGLIVLSSTHPDTTEVRIKVRFLVLGE